MAIKKEKLNNYLDTEFFKFELNRRFNMTIKDLAKKLNLADFRLWRVLRENTIDISDILGILKLLDVKFEDLFRLKEDGK